MLGILEQILKQRKGDNYYLYASSYFSNNVIVVDYDFNNDGNPNDASIVGRILIVTSPNTVIDDKVADLAEQKVEMYSQSLLYIIDGFRTFP